MKYAPTIFFGLLLLSSLSPWLTMIFDFYWWFFHGVTFSGMMWSGDTGFLRTLGLFLTIPPIIIFGMLFYTSTNELEHKLRMEKHE